MKNPCSRTGKKPTEASIKTQKSIVDRLNRIEGQIRGIKSMIEKETYCDDIINQIEASRSALHSVQIILLESHIKNCVVDQIQHGDTDVIEEILRTIKRLTR
ncbi:MAG TPA: metal-sensitive transcriptional regulator [Clostridia bacterium]|nr:metal-sensitive transcriptional regulator [Clostridia bacterium]HZX21154.1 metal-sensitive transcriptional regulator [Clostridia bacterium]